MKLKIKIENFASNINESHWYYRATKSNIYLSLGAIKGVGYQSVKSIVDERYQMVSIKISLILLDEYQIA